ncbi:MAG TPA: NADH-quinone oxidoreductase subunit NuoK [Terriglobales bacterium]|nr:NADH-quinone oxidoreductase subunit NuoK [Terriglobales bacterium]
MMPWGLALAAVLFSLGLAGLLARRNLLLVLVSIEVMLNSTGVAFIAAGSGWNQPDGQVMFLFILAVAAAEVAVGLALTLQLHHQYETVDMDAAAQLRDREEE